MPLYHYECPNCTTEFEQYLPLKQYKTPVPCPTCGRTGKKVLTAKIQRDEPVWLNDAVRDALQDRDAPHRPIENRTDYNRHLKDNGIVERS